MADRDTGLFALTATLVMTELNPAALVAFSSLGYLAGTRALGLPMVFLVGLLFYALVMAKKWKAYDGQCVSAWFGHRFSQGLGRWVAFWLLMAMILFSASYVKSMALLYQPWVNLSPLWLSLLLTLACLMCCARGGLRAIIGLDVFSFVLTLILFPALLIVTWTGADGNFQAPSSASTMLPTTFIISLVMITCMTYILAPWYGQKIFSARSEKIAFRSVALASVLVFAIYALAVVVTALIALSHPGLDPQIAFGVAMDQSPPWLAKGMYGLMFLISATTLCGVWCAMATLVLSQLPVKNTSYRPGMMLIGLSAALSWVVANAFIDQVLDKLILANIPIFALSFALIGGMYFKRFSLNSAWATTVTGFAWGVFCYVYYTPSGNYTWYWATYGLVLMSLAYTLTEWVVPTFRTAPRSRSPLNR